MNLSYWIYNDKDFENKLKKKVFKSSKTKNWGFIFRNSGKYNQTTWKNGKVMFLAWYFLLLGLCRWLSTFAVILLLLWTCVFFISWLCSLCNYLIKLCVRGISSISKKCTYVIDDYIVWHIDQAFQLRCVNHCKYKIQGIILANIRFGKEEKNTNRIAMFLEIISSKVIYTIFM